MSALLKKKATKDEKGYKIDLGVEAARFIGSLSHAYSEKIYFVKESPVISCSFLHTNVRNNKDFVRFKHFRKNTSLPLLGSPHML